VAGYYENRASEKDAEARALQAQAPLSFGTVVGISPSSQLGQILSQDQILQQLSQKANAAFSESSTALRKDEQYYKRIAKLQPDDPNTQYHLAQIADFLGDTKVAIPAYRTVIKLAPTDPTASTARERLAVLTLSAGAGK
jgi:regulator of sirC expression with transglutaminase-like and TPR domain